MTVDRNADTDVGDEAGTAVEAGTAEAVAVTDARPRWLTRRLAGQIMVAVAVVGFIAALVGSVVAWQLVGDLASGTDRSLAIGEDALSTLDGTIDVAEAVVAAVDDGLTTVQSTLSAVARTVEDTAALAATTASFADDVPPSIDQIDEALATVQDLSGTIDAVLRELSRVPLAPDYDPAVPLGDAIADVRDDLRPIAANLRDASGELEGFAGSSDELIIDLDALASDVGAVKDALGGSTELLERYRATAAEAADLASESREELDTDLMRTRILIVVLGLTVAVGQIVPFWVGRELLLDVDPKSSSAGATS